jgi:tetratricopeptide (TPR) repeat protein
MITRPDHPDSNLLFDREEFANYFSLIDQYKTSFKQNNDYSAAQSGLLQLTTEYPSYPDAYVALGEISTKFKDHAAAIDYYQRAQQLCPFNANLAYLIALQCERINKQFALQPPYPDLQIENFFNAAKAEREDERSFRNWYHIKLRQILIPLRLINTDKLLREDLDEDSDYSDITLTNGAVVDAYYANKAFAINLHSIAKYYCQKAILKYEHDFISATKCAEIYYQAGETRKSLEEISRLIDKYNYSISYSLRANFYTASNENRLAIADISKCLVLADKSDMDLIKASNENFLTLLEIFEEKNSIDLQTNDNTTIEIMKLHQKITNSSSQYRCAEEIRLLSNILKKYPAKVLAYTVRGDAMQKKGDIDSALLDYSLALWFAFGSQIPEIYFNRSCLNLRRGEFNAAHYNLNNSIYCLQHDNKHHEIDSLLQRFSVQCVTAGNVHLQNGKFYSAEKIFASGILRKPSFKLYLQLAIALGIQEQYAAALSVLETASQMQNISAGMQAEIHKKIRYFAEKKRRQEQHNFYNFKSHEIRNAKINIKFLQT